MPPQVLWISIWTTLALWLGSIGGCASSSQAPADVSSTTSPANTSATIISSVSIVNQPVAVADGVDLTKPANTAAEVAISQSTADRESPSLRGLDRSHWTKVTVSPDDGKTTHYPIYFRDCPLDAPVPNLSNLADTQAQLEAALQNPSAGNYSQTNLQGMATQPLKAAFDLLAVPVRKFIDPPLTPVTTP